MSILSSQFEAERKRVKAERKIATAQTPQAIASKASKPDPTMYTYDYEYFKPTLNNGNYTPAIITGLQDIGRGVQSMGESFKQVLPAISEFESSVGLAILDRDPTGVLNSFFRKGLEEENRKAKEDIRLSQEKQAKIASEASNPWVVLAGSAVGQVGVGLLAGIPSAGLGTAVMFSPSVANIYNEARKKHDAGSALGIATLYGIPAYYAEKVGLNAILGKALPKVVSASRPTRLLGATAGEAGTEVVQQAWENVVTKFAIDEKRNIWDGLVEAGFGGAVGGSTGATGVMAGQSAIARLENMSAFNKARKENSALNELYEGFRSEGLSRTKSQSAVLDTLDSVRQFASTVNQQLNTQYEQRVESDRIARERMRLNELAGQDMSIAMKQTIDQMLKIDKLEEGRVQAEETMRAEDIKALIMQVRKNIGGGQQSLFEKGIMEGTQASLFEEAIRSWLVLDMYKGAEQSLPARLMNPQLSAERDARMKAIVDMLAEDTGTTIQTPSITVDTGLNPDGTYNVEVVVDGENKQEVYARDGRFETEEEALYYGTKKAEKNATSPRLQLEQQDLTKDFNAWQNERDTMPLEMYEEITDPAILELAKDAPQKFRLNEQVYDIIKSVGSKLYTRNGPRGVMGSVLRKSKTMFLKGTGLVSVAGHEVMHVVAETMGMPDAIINNSPELYAQLEKVYNRYYPKVDKTASANTIAHEGLAMAMQKMLETPTKFKEQFPLVVQEVFSKDGEFYNPQIARAFDRFRVLVAQYQKLEALKKGTAILAGDVENSKQSPFSMWQNMRSFLLDNNFIQQILEKSLGWDYRKEMVPSLLLRQMRASYNAITNNISKKNNGYYAFRGDTWVKTLPYNWATLYSRLREQARSMGMKSRNDIEEFINEFNGWLIGRRGHFAHKRLADMKRELASLGDPNDTNIALEDLERYEALSYAIESLEKVLTADYITPELLQEMYEGGQKLFETPGRDGLSPAEMYDNLTGQDLETQHVFEIIPEEMYDVLRNIPGYAPYLRAGQDDFTQDVDDIVHKMFGDVTEEYDNKSGAIKERKGGMGIAIKNPLLASMYRHQVVTRMAYLNEAKKRTINMLLEHAPELAREEAWTPGTKKQNAVEYIEGGQRKVAIVDSAFYKNFIANFDMTSFEGAMKFFEQTKALFHLGTTGMYLAFTITNALMLDSATSAVNTNQAKVTPFFEGVKTSYLRARRALLDKLSSKEALTDEQLEILSYADEYINLFAYGDTVTTSLTMTDRELSRFFAEDKAIGATFGEKVIDGLEQVLTKKGAKKLYKTAFAGVERLSMEAEMLSRLGEYVLSRKSGDPQLVSAQKASEVATDFGRRGTYLRTGGGKSATVLVYFTSQLANLENLLMVGTEKKKFQRAVVMNGIWLAMSLYGLSGIIGGITGESEEDRKKRLLMLQEKSMDERARYIYYAQEGGKLGQWRVGEGLSSLAMMINLGIEVNLGVSSASITDILSIPLEAIPQQIKPWETTEWLVSLMPKGADTAFSLALGKRLYPTGADIVPKNLQNLPKRLQQDERTSWLGNLIGNDLISPIEVDFAVENSLGRSVKLFTKPMEYLSAVSITPEAKHYPFSGKLVRVFFEERARLDAEIRAGEKKVSDRTSQELLQIKRERDKIEPLNDLLQEYTKLRKADPEEQNVQTKRAYIKLITSLQNYYQ